MIKGLAPGSVAIGPVFLFLIFVYFMKNSTKKYLFSIVFTLLTALISTCFPSSVQAGQAVTDQLDRKIMLPDSPKRIVSLAPNITEIIYAIGQGHLLVGATQFSNYPEQAKALPRVGSYVHLDIEKIVALKPDLCIATKDGNPIEVIQVLEALDVPIYAVDPRNLSTVMATLEEIGGLLNAQDAAQSVVADMKGRISRVVNEVGKSRSRPRVFYQIGISPIVSAGTETCIHELIEMAGGDNIAKGPASYPRFSYEQVLGLSPDIIIITSMARGAVFEKVKKQWMQWEEIPAIKHNRISLANSDLLDRPTPRLVEGLELLAKIIHPELFPDLSKEAP